MMAMRVAVVLPTYDEADNIEDVLTQILAAIPSAEILVVDDASPDGTADRAEALADELGRIRVLRRGAKRGLGSAYRAGFDRVLNDDVEAVVSMDADLSHDPARLPALIGALIADDGVGMVIGSRYVAGGSVVNWPWYRRLMSRWGNRYTGWALGLPLSDCTSGYRVHTARVLRDIEVGTTTAEGYAFLTEVARRVVETDVRVVEVPITFVDRTRGRSKMSWRIVAESMLFVTRTALADRRSRRFRRRRAVH